MRACCTPSCGACLPAEFMGNMESVSERGRTYDYYYYYTCMVCMCRMWVGIWGGSAPEADGGSFWTFHGVSQGIYSRHTATVAALRVRTFFYTAFPCWSWCRSVDCNLFFFSDWPSWWRLFFLYWFKIDICGGLITFHGCVTLSYKHLFR